MALRRRDEIEAREGRDLLRLARRGAASLVYSLVVVAAVLVLLAISFQLNQTLDTTRGGEHQLAPQTLTALEKLEQPVKLYALFRQEQKVRWENYWERLRRYRMASDMIEVEMIDPVSRPGRVRDLGLSVDQEGARLEGSTVVVRGERKVVFRGTEEEEITNAIMEVAREGSRVIGFIRGYGERDPSSNADAGYSSLAAALRQEYYEVRDVSLADGIPPDVLVLIAGGLRLPVPEHELDRLATWLDGGGRLLALVDVEDTSGIDRVLDAWGLRTTGHTLYDSRENLNRDQRFVRVSDYSGHDVVRGFGKNLPTAFPTVGVVEHFEVSGTIYHDDLARSSALSWGVAPDGTRTPGPHAVAAAVWQRETSEGQEVITRLILFGDADFASRAYLPAGANRNLLLNCVAWLSRQQDLIAIRRQPLEGQRIEFDGTGMRVLYAAVFGAPLLVTLIGVATLLRRRGR